MHQKFDELFNLYKHFEDNSRELKKDRACTKGCSYCCEAAGRIDVTTLEGFRIQTVMKKMPKPRRLSLAKALRQEIKKREAGITAACPFLLKNKACMIYEVRPFSCRRIYSMHVCTKDNPPAVSRRVMDMAGETIKALQSLDDTGYSGHLSYILKMLSEPAFVDTYLAGSFKPEAIMAFGKTHQIAINRMMGQTVPR